MGIKTRVLTGLVAFAILGASIVAPLPEGLSREGLIALGITVFNVTLWLGDVVPKPIAGLIVLLLLPLLGVSESLSATFKNFISSVFFFLLAAFAIAAMVKNSNLPQRLMSLMLKHLKGSTPKLVLAFMITSAVISTVMSDLAACALFAAVAVAVFMPNGQETTYDKDFVKAVMIGIPAGSLAGGIATPIGSSSNFTMLELLTQTTGIEVSFTQWMVVGVPIALISVVASWAAICMAFKLKPLSEEQMQLLHDQYTNLGPVSLKEKKIVATITLMFGFWISTAWITWYDSTMVAMIGMIFMFLPGMDLLNWKEYDEEVPWDLVIMLGCLMSLAASLLNTGAIDWVATAVLGEDGAGWNPWLLMFAISAVIALLRAFIPSGPPIVVVLTPAMVHIALMAGLDPLCVIMAMSTWAQITFLMPAIDALYLITYSYKVYSIGDVLKFGLPLTLVLLVVLSLVTPPLVALSQML